MAENSNICVAPSGGNNIWFTTTIGIRPWTENDVTIYCNVYGTDGEVYEKPLRIITYSHVEANVTGTEPDFIDDWWFGPVDDPSTESQNDQLLPYFQIRFEEEQLTIMPNTTKEDALSEIGKPEAENSAMWIRYRIPAEFNDEDTINSYLDHYGLVFGEIVEEQDYKYITFGMKLWESYKYAMFGFRMAETEYVHYTHVGMPGPLDAESSIYEWIDIKAAIIGIDRIEGYFSVEYDNIDDSITLTPLVSQEEFEQLTRITDVDNMTILIGINWYDGTMSDDAFLNSLNDLSRKNENFCSYGIRWTGGLTVKPWTDNDELLTFDMTDFYGNPFQKTIRIVTYANTNNE